MTRPKKYKTVAFKNVEGMFVPCQPWPQKFYISGWLYDKDEFEVRPLTLTGLVKGVGKNFVTMTYWRFMVTLRILGFLTTKECERLSWLQFTFKFWKHQMWWRLRIVRFIRARRTFPKNYGWRLLWRWAKDVS